MVHGAKSRKDS